MIMRSLVVCLLCFGVAACTTQTKYVAVPTLSVAPPDPRPLTWKPVDIKREAADRYVMDQASRNNLQDNLADIERYTAQSRAVIHFFRTTDVTITNQ